MIEQWLRVKKIKFYVILGVVTTIIVAAVAGVMMVMMLLGSQEANCWDNDTHITEAGQGIGGNWRDKNSDTYKGMRHAADRFQKELHLSGDNIAAALAVGLRESHFNPKAVNPSGAVKGIWQWGTGGINGNRYMNTPDTVEGQVQLAINELRGSHKAALIGLATAKGISDSLVAWDTKFEGVGENDPQRKVADTAKTAAEIKKVFSLDFEGTIDVFDKSNNESGLGNTAKDAQTSALAATACEQPIDGTGSIKESGLLFWDKNSIPEDVLPLTHSIKSKQIDWGQTTPDAYNQCAGFVQAYMNAIWSPNFTFRGNGNESAEAVAKATGVKVTTTPKAGAIFASDRPNHTGVVLHVLANGDLIIANQNAMKSGQNAGTTKDYEITLVPKKAYMKDSEAIGYGNMTFAYPGDNPKYKLNW
ncbi:phage tail tip lysozyme [Leuconostoc citreum]|uniref:phage tail tip lysozyme n=1 Tax=Leuconostoc citreum TaxID=33964 RepID=UPI0032DE965A